MAHPSSDGQTSTIESRFYFGDSPIRVVGTKEDPEWVASDICRALGYPKAKDALRSVPSDEKGAHRMHTLGGDQEILTLKEPGLYRLIFRSNKKEAEAFRRWVFHEVLPAIRKTGSYSGYGHAGAALQEAGEFIKEMDVVVQTQAKAISAMASKAAAIMSLARWHRSPNPHQQALPFNARETLGKK